MRFRLFTLRLSKTIELHDVTYGDLYATRMYGGPKRIEVYAFSNENALVWTGLVKRPKLQVTVHRIHWEFECHLTNELTDVFSCFPLGCSTYNRWKQCKNSTRPCRTFSVIKRGSDQSGACCCWRHRIGEYPSFSLWR